MCINKDTHETIKGAVMDSSPIYILPNLANSFLHLRPHSSQSVTGGVYEPNPGQGRGEGSGSVSVIAVVMIAHDLGAGLMKELLRKVCICWAAEFKLQQSFSRIDDCTFKVARIL